MSLTHAEHRELLRALSLDEMIPTKLGDRAARHISTCPECQLVLSRTRKLQHKLNPMLSTAHPASDVLVAYLTADDAAKNEDEAVEVYQQVDAHLKTCALCQTRVQQLRNEINQVEHIMQNVEAEMTFERDYRPAAAERKNAPIKKTMFFPPPAKVLFPVVGVFLALLLLFFSSLSTLPKNYELAQLKSDRLDVLPIGRGLSPTESELLIAESFINTGQYDKARQRLSKISESDLLQDQVLRLRLAELMLTLKSAHRSFVYLFPHFDKEAVRKSLQHMEEILNDVPAIPNDAGAHWGLAHYYCAKAYLMLEDENAALAHLQNARLVKHLRRPETEQLVRALTSK